jgi:hypothetical protein
MSKEQDKIEREQAAARLKLARQKAGYRGAKTAADQFGWPVEKYKAHDDGRNGFGTADARKYAKAYGVSVEWLVLGTGDAYDAKRIAIESFNDEAASKIHGINRKLELLAMDDLDDFDQALDKIDSFLEVNVTHPDHKK